MPKHCNYIETDADHDDVCPGGPMWICGDLQIEMCEHPDCRRAADYLCDWPMGGGKTCDLMLCARHRDHIGHERDLCEIHADLFRKVRGGANLTPRRPWPPTKEE